MANFHDFEVGTPEYHQNLLKVFEPVIQEVLVPSHICTDLAHFLDKDAVRNIRYSERKSMKEAVSMLLKFLIESKESGWFQGFIDALNRNAYTVLSDHLTGAGEMKDAEFFSNLILTFAPRLIQDIVPDDITSYLLQHGTLSSTDVRDIVAHVGKDGDSRSGMIVLLERISKRKDNWFPDFIAALKQGPQLYIDIAAEIEPCIAKACPGETYIKADQVQALNENPNHYLGPSPSTSKNKCVVAPSTSATTECIDTGEDAIQDPVTRYHERMSQRNVPLKAGNVPIMAVNPQLCNIQGQQSHGMEIPSSTEDLTAVKIQVSDQTRDPDDTPMIPVEPITFDNAMQIPLEMRNNLTFPSGQKHSLDKNVHNIEDNNSDNNEVTDAEDMQTSSDTPSAVNDGQGQGQSGEDQEIETMATAPEPLVLRSYQKELAQPAINGQNVIIVAPTGSGKTHVALYITQHHLEDQASTDVKGKVVFLVPTVELVEQQLAVYRKYLPQYEMGNISGDIKDSQKVPLSKLVDHYDVIVMTPQILFDSVRRNDIESLSKFTLMIFDECHHTAKQHPYNQIMALYIEEKNAESRTYFLPQVVGMTASVGVGKARNQTGAQTHILSLCANLDAYEISTVEQHKEELNQHVNKPNEDKIITKDRVEDPFLKKINGIMLEIEKKMREIVARTNIPEMKGFDKLIQSPSTRGGDPYVQWISGLRKPVARIYDQQIRRPLVACTTNLKIYNLALMINEDCRTKDALNFVLQEFKEIDDTHKDKTDHWLDKLFYGQQNLLEGISNDHRYDNPKLLKLQEVIMKKYEENPDMRAIVFCKTRDMTVALENWMKSSSALNKLDPNRIVGGNASAERGGMTSNKQEDVLEFFKEGKHKVLIATSVAEEGLDISKCNLVIRYEYVTNEIAMVQSRGRGRAEDSDYLVMGNVTRGAAHKEDLNRIRENMMNEAIRGLKQMPRETREKRIKDLQLEAQTERQMTESGKQGKAAIRSMHHNDDFELRCHKCDQFCCLASDIRIIEQSHHVILDETIRDRLIIEKHPNPKAFGDLKKTDKIFCKMCRADWGIQATYKCVRFCVIKIDSFIIINTNNDVRDICKKWKNVTFPVSMLTPTELQEHAANFTDSTE